MDTKISQPTDEKKIDGIVQFTTFGCSGEEYGIEVLKVREIIRMPVITKIPNTPDYVEGIINLRGKVIPIVSMRKKFGLQEADNSSQTRIIVMDIHSSITGFIVDCVSEVLRIHSSDIQPPPIMATAQNDSSMCIQGIYGTNDKLISIVDLELLFQNIPKLEAINGIN
ncbi:MAG: chemotaxis protein CheW [Candidatus Gracilibacteria bacterium]|nr:chemotaxis protein CheW [Candidatus Gracilibacteria bacterium]